MNKKANKANVVLFVLISIAVTSVFCLAIVNVFMHNVRKDVGVLTPTVLRKGQDGTVTVTPLTPLNVPQDTLVTWYVDDKKVQSSPYDGNVTLNYVPTHTGDTKIKVSVGRNYSQTMHFDVQKPLLTCNATDCVITYGEQLPYLQYTATGFVEGNENSLHCNLCCNCNNVPDAGTYTIDFVDKEIIDEYDVVYNTATLTVLPRTLSTTTNFDKVYDGTTKVRCGNVKLEGIIDGDDVTMDCEQLCYESKDAGNNVSVTGTLTGKDAHNYVMDNMHGNVKPKTLTVNGFVAESKTYDGTNKAQVSNVGRLVGVVDGDSVAIGTITANFANNHVQRNKVVTAHYTLVGLDKNNYTVADAYGTANVTQKLADKLNGNDAVQSNN